MRAFLVKRLIRVTAVVLVLVSTACGDGVDAEPPSTTAPSNEDTKPVSTEVSFSSNGFELVGDLHLPGGLGPHPAVVLIHGSGPQTRLSTPTSDLVRRKFLDAGYAALVWDKPGSGESTGEFEEGFTITQRAEILVDAVAWLAAHDSIDPHRIGAWGLSQAGWVIPRALSMTDDIAFMIVVSGGGEDSIEQMTFQWTRQALCRGATDAEIEIMNTHGAPALKATTYDEYEAAMQPLLAIPRIDTYVGVDIELAGEDEWVPWPRDIDAFFDPATILEQTTIPVLSIFGEHDSQIDPVQGAQAYQAALAAAGNTDFEVVTIPSANHIMRPTEGPCGPESSGIAKEYLDLLDEWLASHPA